MRKELLLLGAFGMLTTATLCAQEFHLQPTPQEYITQKDSVDIPRQYQILSGNSVQDGPALPLLRSLMPEEVLGASFRVYIGVKGDKIIKKYQHRIPRKSEGYFLKIEKDCIKRAPQRKTAFGCTQKRREHNRACLRRKCFRRGRFQARRQVRPAALF